jgi:hypothetical protein
MRAEAVRRAYLALTAGFWLLVLIFALSRSAAGPGAPAVYLQVGGLTSIAAFATACLIVSLRTPSRSKLGILALASGAPLWLAGSTLAGRVGRGEWDLIVLPIFLLLVAVPFALIAYSLWRAP